MYTLIERFFTRVGPWLMCLAVMLSWGTAQGQVATPPPTLSSLGAQADGKIITVSSKGATGNGTTDDTAAIQTALNAVNSSGGGTVTLSYGNYLISAPLTIGSRTNLVGMGGGDRTGAASSQIVMASPTLDAIQVNASGCTLTDFGVKNTATTPTAGAGIHVGNPYGAFTHLTRLTVAGFYNDVQFDEGYYYTVTDCTFLDPVHYGFFTTAPSGEEFDHGDMSFLGCTFTLYNTARTPAAALKWTGGGGIRFVDCKINGREQPVSSSAGTFVNGLDLAVPDGGSTSDLIITGCSIENCTGVDVQLAQSGTGTGNFSNVVITGNEFGESGNGITLSGTNSGNFSNGMISGNVFFSTSGGIYGKNFANLTVGNNSFQSSGVLSFDAGMLNLKTAEQTVMGDNITLLLNNNVNVANHFAYGQSRYEFNREIPATTSSATYSTLYHLTPVTQNASGVFELTLTGSVAGVGPFAWQGKRAISRGTGAVTTTTIGTDSTTGAVVDPLFDVSTTSGDLYLKLKLDTAGGTDVVGWCSLVVNGPIYLIKKGT